jgi:predicted RNA polymerase sigma factor
MNDDALRVIAPKVLGILVRRGHDFAAAEDALQEALLEAHQRWAGPGPGDPEGWLLTVAGRKLIDAHRSDAVRVGGIRSARVPRSRAPSPRTMSICSGSSTRPGTA